MKRKPNLSPEERDWRRTLIAMISVSIAALAALFFSYSMRNLFRFRLRKLRSSGDV